MVSQSKDELYQVTRQDDRVVILTSSNNNMNSTKGNKGGRKLNSCPWIQNTFFKDGTGKLILNNDTKYMWDSESSFRLPWLKSEDQLPKYLKQFTKMFLGIKEEKGQTSNTLGKPFSLLKTVLESLMCSSSSWFCQEDKELVAFPKFIGPLICFFNLTLALNSCKTMGKTCNFCGS